MNSLKCNLLRYPKEYNGKQHLLSDMLICIESNSR